MAYSGRTLSPGGRHLHHHARNSDQTLAEPYRSSRHSTYSTPRNTVGGVIPLSEETIINIPPPRDARGSEQIDHYTGRPRRSSLLDPAHRSSSSTSAFPTHAAAARPHVVPGQISRTSSPPRSSRDDRYYVAPISSQEYRGGHQKKLYSVDNGGQARLVADVNIPAERHHRRRESDDPHSQSYASGTDRERGRREYHASGSGSKARRMSIDDDDGFSYTDPASMYRDTEPRPNRPRRGSLDRAGPVRERPFTMIEADPRRSVKELGPPPSTRGWDKINRTSRDVSRDVGSSPNRSRGYTDGAYRDVRDAHIAPRSSSADKRIPTVHQSDGHYYEDREEPRRRRGSLTREKRPDQSVERRGFGIRSDSRSNSQTRGYRSSDESFDQARYSAPLRRDTAPVESRVYDERRFDQERKDRGYAERLQADEYEGHVSRERRDTDTRRREREVDIDRERERERARQLEPPVDRGADRTSRPQEVREREYNRMDDAAQSDNEASGKPGFVQTAASGLAAAAASMGLGSMLNRSDKREKDEDQDDYRERRIDRNEKRDRDDNRDEYQDRRPEQRSFDEAVPRKTTDRDQHRDPDRGLGFAFEKPTEAVRNVQPPKTDRSHDLPPVRSSSRDRERERESRNVEMPKSAVDPDEDYRQRIQQIQRELEASKLEEAKGSGSDSDRARRRRDREQREREREQRERERERERGSDSRPGVPSAASAEIRSNKTSAPQQYQRRSLDDDRSSSATTTMTASDSRAKPSILDRPMTDEPAQILDNSLSDRRENRVRIVDPPTEEEDKRPKGILKRPTEKFPEDHNAVREGVTPLKDLTGTGIPPGAKWTKITREMVNPTALEEAGERFEERDGFVVVLRPLTKEQVQKLADRTSEIRARDKKEIDRIQRRGRDHGRGLDEYEEDDSADEFKKKTPKMLGAPSTSGVSSEDGGRERRRDRERDSNRDKDRDRDRDRDRERERERDRDRDRDRERDRERERDRDRDRD